jgi:hypothetical protein
MAKVKLEPQAAEPTHVVLLGDVYLDGVPHWRAGKVVPFNSDVAQMLKVERVSYRPATQRERELAGFAE